MRIAIFNVADKEYAAEITQIKEVIRMRPITPIPEAAEFVEGVIGLRGKVIPIVNLRSKLGLEKRPSKTDRIIITQISGHYVGVIVDGMTDVLPVEETQITPPDAVLKKADYLIGVAKIAKRLVLIVDMEKLLSGEVSESIKKVHSRVEVRRKKDGVSNG